jgi:transposase
MAYSIDIRERVLKLYDEGKKTKQVSKQLLVSPAYARRVKQRRHLPPKTIGGSKPKLDETARSTLAGWIDEKPDATLAELRKRLASDLKITVSMGCLWMTLKKMKLTFKKSL